MYIFFSKGTLDFVYYYFVEKQRNKRPASVYTCMFEEKGIEGREGWMLTEREYMYRE